MPKLTKGQITKANKKNGGRFAPKYRAFNILQNNIEDVVKKSTLMWKLIYGITSFIQGEEDPFKGRNNGDEDEDKEEDKEKDNTIVEETQKKTYDMATTEEQQEEKSVQDTQILSMIPPHDTNEPIDIITIKDVPGISAQNINPFTAKDLKKILDHSILQEGFCENLVLVNVDELQKVVADITREKVNTQEPPSIPIVTKV